MWGLLLMVLHGAFAASAEDLVDRAEQAFAEGDLTKAAAMAEEAITLGDQRFMAEAERILVELAIRQGTPDLAWLHLAGYFRWAPADEIDHAWTERVSLRIRCDVAEQNGSLEEALALLDSLQASSPLGLLEEMWVDWARVRLEIRFAELAGQTQQALDLIADVSVWPGSPEERWMNFARARVEVTLAENACDLSTAARALDSLSPPHSAIEQAWQTQTNERLTLRQAVADGDLALAKRKVQDVLAQPGIAPRHQAWAEGFADWLEREQLRLTGATISEDLTERVINWRVDFAEQGGCELPSDQDRSRSLVESSPIGSGSHTPARTTEEDRSPSLRWAHGRLAAGVGGLGWIDSEDMVTAEARITENVQKGQVPAIGVLLDGSIHPLRVGAAQLGFSTSVRGALQVEPSMYWTGSVVLGPELAWERLVLQAWAGGWTLSVPGTNLVPSGGGDSVEPWCSSSGEQISFCNSVGAKGDYVFRRLILARMAGGALSWAPARSLEFTVQLGAGPGPRVVEAYYMQQNLSWVFAPELTWQTPLEPLMMVCSGYVVGAGRGAMLEGMWLVGVGVGW